MGLDPYAAFEALRRRQRDMGRPTSMSTGLVPKNSGQVKGAAGGGVHSAWSAADAAWDAGDDDAYANFNRQFGGGSYGYGQGMGPAARSGGGGAGTLAAGYFNPAFGPGGGNPASRTPPTRGPSGASSPAAGFPAGGGVGGFGGAGGAGGAGAAGGAGGLGGKLSDAYGKLIDQGGLFSPEQKSGAINRMSGTFARGTNDAIQAAREDAARRGDTTGSTLATTEGRIRNQGVADQSRATSELEMAFAEKDRDALIAALGGGGNLMQALASLELSGQQLSLQQLQVLAELVNKGLLPPGSF